MTLDSEALFAKELYDLLAKLEVVSPTSNKVIACLLAGMVIRGKCKKVDACSRASILKEKSLKSKGKSGAIGKVYLSSMMVFCLLTRPHGLSGHCGFGGIICRR